MGLNFEILDQSDIPPNIHFVRSGMGNYKGRYYYTLEGMKKIEIRERIIALIQVIALTLMTSGLIFFCDFMKPLCKELWYGNRKITLFVNMVGYKNKNNSENVPHNNSSPSNNSTTSSSPSHPSTPIKNKEEKKSEVLTPGSLSDSQTFVIVESKETPPLKKVPRNQFDFQSKEVRGLITRTRENALKANMGINDEKEGYDSIEEVKKLLIVLNYQTCILQKLADGKATNKDFNDEQLFN